MDIPPPDRFAGGGAEGGGFRKKSFIYLGRDGQEIIAHYIVVGNYTMNV